MVTEPARIDAPTTLSTAAGSWPDASVRDLERLPVDPDLIETASELVPGRALDLGCGSGQDSLWLAERGWAVTGVDPAAGAINEAREGASAAGLTAIFEVGDLADVRPASRFDLVVCTYALPARGSGRSRVLEMAATTVAPGGTILLAELDVSLHRQGWMAEKYLVSTEELERHLGAFRIRHSGVRMRPRRHGYEELLLPAAIVVATRRTDLRSL